MYECPITHFKNNLIFGTDGSCWSCYKIQGFSYDWLSDDKKKRQFVTLMNFLGGIMSEAKIRIIPVQPDLSSRFENEFKNGESDDPLNQSSIRLKKLTKKYLDDRGESAQEYRTYIEIKLQKTASEVEDIKMRIGEVAKDPVGALEAYMGLGEWDVPHAKLERYKELARDWADTAGLRLPLEAVSEGEMHWLIGRMGYRGLHTMPAQQEYRPGFEEVKTLKGLTAIRPIKKDIINIFEGRMVPDGRILKVETEEGTSYQSFMVLTHIPDDLQFPGSEWLYELQRRNIQAEVCMHIRLTEHGVALRKVENKKQEINNQVDHVHRARAPVPRNLKEGVQDGIMLESEIKSSYAPMLTATTMFSVAADNKAELETRVRRLQTFYKDRQFRIARPFSDQTRLYFSFMPCFVPKFRDYAMQLTTQQVASAMFGVSREIGDESTSYIGYIGKERMAAWLTPHLACLNNKSAGIFTCGDLGFGKSFNMNLLLIQGVINGGYGFILDPKAERGHWETQLTVLKGYINTVTLSNKPKDKGRLDPYLIYRDDLWAANELAIGVIIELFKLEEQSDQYLALLEATQRIQQGEGAPSMTKLIGILRDFPEEDELSAPAKKLARAIRLQKDAGMSQLLIGDGTEQAIRLENRLNIVQVNNLKMPMQEKNKEDYEREETVSVVIMSVVSHMARTMAHMHEGIPKYYLFDESWMLSKTSAGKSIFHYLSRMGRSLYLVPIYNGHSVLDLPDESFRNTITYKFFFHTSETEEAKRMLEMAGIEESDTNIARIKALKNRQCLFQDMEGRVDVLTFDAIFKDIIEVLSTTPKPKGKQSIEETVEECTSQKSQHDGGTYTIEELLRKEHIVC